MKRTYAGALAIGLALVWMVSAPGPVWGQWTTGSGGTIYCNGGKVGIGTSTPAGKLSVYNDTDGTYGITLSTGAGKLTLQEVGSTANLPYIEFRNATGTRAGYIGWGGGALGASLDIVMENSRNLYIGGGNVGIGTATPQYKLAVNGTIGAKDVTVTNTGWPDYVFRPGYRLRPLSEVGAYIRAHHHLPDIPTEAEVMKTGVSVGEMQAKLLAKIEELTLHMIQADERIARLERVNRDLRKQNRRIQERPSRPEESQ